MIKTTRWFGIALLVGALVGCGNIERPGDNAKAEGKPEITLATQAPVQQGAPSGNSGEVSANIPALPAGVELVTLPSGLQYADVQVGTGAEVAAGDTAAVYYTGWLKADGQKFDSNVGTNQPFPVQPVGQAPVIDGWNLGLIGMKEGGKRRLIIPAALGYGEAGNGPIPPNAELVFDVEAVKVTKAGK